MWKSLILPLLAAVRSDGSAQAAHAIDEINVSRGATLAGPGLAAHGYDVVAFFTEGKPRIGSDAYAVAHGGGTYRFVSRANLETFKADRSNTSPPMAASAPMAWRWGRSSTAIHATGRSSTAGCT